MAALCLKILYQRPTEGALAKFTKFVALTHVLFSFIQVHCNISEDASYYDKGWCLAKHGSKCLLLNRTVNIIYINVRFFER